MNDNYTRAVLTLIAGCLVLLCLHFCYQPQSVKANLPELPKEVKIVGFATDLNLPVTVANGSIPVQIQSSAVLPVGIVGAKSTGTVPVFLRAVNGGIVLHVTSGQ